MARLEMPVLVSYSLVPITLKFILCLHAIVEGVILVPPLLTLEDSRAGCLNKYSPCPMVYSSLQSVDLYLHELHCLDHSSSLRRGSRSRQ
jgi:hypothetical protein